MRLILVVLSLFMISACASSATEQVVVTTATQLPLTQTFHPLSVKTMIEEIDIVLRAVESRDAQKVRDLFSYINTFCRTVNALGGPPPCRKGEPEGTPVEAFPILGAEGGHLRRDEIALWQELDVIGVYAVYQASDSAFSDEYYPAGDYAIALVGNENGADVILRVAQGEIVRIDYIFGSSPSALAEIVQRNSEYLVLAPVGQ